MTCTDFVRLCGGDGESLDVEAQILSVGREFLPPAAIVVLDGGQESADYWTWLCAQAEGMLAARRNAR